MPRLPWQRPTPNPLAAELAEVRAQLADLTEQRTTYVTSPSDARIRNSSLNVTSSEEHDKRVLYDTYTNFPWLSAAFDVIAKRIISGGWAMKADDEDDARASATAATAAENLFLYCNESDDLNQLIYQTALSMLIFGVAYWEIVEAGGKPYELYYVNPIGLKEQRDSFGTITGYVQQMDDGTEAEFSTDQILRFCLTGPLGEVTSPVKKLVNTCILYNYALKFGRKFFEHGGKFPFYAKLPEGSTPMDAERFATDWEVRFTGAENAHTMPVVYAGTELLPLGQTGNLELDFLASIRYLRDECLAVVGTPPAMVGVIETGNIGGGTGESQNKAFEYNTVRPIKEQILEKINFRIVGRGFGITGWRFDLPGAEYRADADLIGEMVQKVNAGLITRQHAATHLGDPDPGEGADVAAITYQRGVIPISDLPHIHSDQFVAAQSAAVNSGVDPHATPEDLAQASPRDASAPGPDHPVAARDAQQPDDTEAALADLARWQRVALKAHREGREQRLFTSAHLDPVTTFAVCEGLAAAASPAAIRGVFDAAFAALREGAPALIA